MDLVILGLEGLETLPQSIQVNINRQMAVNQWIFRTRIRLVEIIYVVHERAADVIKDYRCIRTKKHSNGTDATSGSCTSFRVYCYIRWHDKCVASIPALRLDPIDRIEYSICGPITRISWGNTFNIMIPTPLKQSHQHRLHRLGFIKQRLRAYFHPSNLLRFDPVFFQQLRHASKTNRIDIFPVVHTCHLQLPQPNGILSSRCSIILLEIDLVNIGIRKIQFHSYETNILDGILLFTLHICFNLCSYS